MSILDNLTDTDIEQILHENRQLMEMLDNVYVRDGLTDCESHVFGNIVADRKARQARCGY